jgi:hypothetical protein
MLPLLAAGPSYSPSIERDDRAKLYTAAGRILDALAAIAAGWVPDLDVVTSAVLKLMDDHGCEHDLAADRWAELLLRQVPHEYAEPSGRTEPTSAAPGSVEKVAELQRRWAAGLPLWCDGDAVEVDRVGDLPEGRRGMRVSRIERQAREVARGATPDTERRRMLRAAGRGDEADRRKPVPPVPVEVLEPLGQAVVRLMPRPAGGRGRPANPRRILGSLLFVLAGGGAWTTIRATEHGADTQTTMRRLREWMATPRWPEVRALIVGAVEKLAGPERAIEAGRRLDAVEASCPKVVPMASAARCR